MVAIYASFSSPWLHYFKISSHHFFQLLYHLVASYIDRILLVDSVTWVGGTAESLTLSASNGLGFLLGTELETIMSHKCTHATVYQTSQP